MQALEFEIQAKDWEIQLQEAHNIELMHRDEAQCAEIARLKVEVKAPEAIPVALVNQLE